MRAFGTAGLRPMLFLGVFVLAALMPVPAAAAAPSATFTMTSFGPDENLGDEFCAIDLLYQWTGFNNAAFDEVYVYDVTLGVAYGIGWDGDGNKDPHPLFSGQKGEAMGTLVYVGHTVELHADLLSKTGKPIAKTVMTLPTIVNVGCPDPV